MTEFLKRYLIEIGAKGEMITRMTKILSGSSKDVMWQGLGFVFGNVRG
jgi:hypothetical protein